MNNGKEASRKVSPDALAAPTSREVRDLIRTTASGRVKVFGEIRQVAGGRYIPFGSSQRTEIQVGGALVSVHKGTDHPDGAFSGSGRFSQIEVKKGDKTHRLTVTVDATTSPTNPIYEMHDGDEHIGYGTGPQLDLFLASELLSERIPEDAGSRVTAKVVDWVKNKLT